MSTKAKGRWVRGATTKKDGERAKSAPTLASAAVDFVSHALSREERIRALQVVDNALKERAGRDRQTKNAGRGLLYSIQ